MSDPIIDRLDQIEYRADAATRGPWGWRFNNDGFVEVTAWESAGLCSEKDGEFIAAARTDVPQMEQALRAVLDLHKPYEWSFGYGPVYSCTECSRLGGNNGKEEEAEWPCPTAQVIEEALCVETKGGGQ